MKYSIQHAVVCVCSVTHIIQYNSILECNFRPVSIEYRNSAHILSFPPITCTLIVCRTDGKRMQCRRFLLYARYISEENFIICIYIYSIIFIWLAGLTKNQFAIASFIRNQIGADHLLWLFRTSSNTHTNTQFYADASTEDTHTYAAYMFVALLKCTHFRQYHNYMYNVHI